MPRVTKYGDVVAGVGSAVSLNRSTVIGARGSVACFLDPTRLIYQRQYSVTPERWRLETYDLATKEYALVPYGERGANFLSARGGRWMAYVAGTGVYDATGTIWPKAGLAGVGTDGRGAIGADGTIGFVQDYQGGHGLELLTPDGKAIDLPDVAIQTLCIFDRTLAIWVEGGQVKAWGWRDPAPQEEPVSSARVLKMGGVLFLLVTTNTRLILRAWDVPDGTVLDATATTFAADFAEIGNLIRVAWSKTPGEGPEDIEIHDYPPPFHRVPGPIAGDEDKKKPEETPVAEFLSAQITRIVERYAVKFPVPIGPSPADEAFENLCRRWCLGLAEQIRFETNDPRWGVKNAGGGRPQSKDSITFNGPRLLNYDLLTGVGTGRPALASPAGEDITGQTFMPVQPVNHLAGDVPPIDKPPVDKPSGLDEAAVKRIVAEAVDAAKAEQRAALAKLSERIDGLKPEDPAALKVAIAVELQNYEVSGGTSRSYGHGHTVKLGISRRQP